MTPALFLLASAAASVPPVLAEFGELLKVGAPGPAPAAAEPCPGGKRRVVVGYEPGIPPIEPRSDTRAVRVLGRAFPPPCFELVPKTYQREDIGPSVVKGLIDIGVVGIAAAASYAERGMTSLPARDTEGVDTLLLHPASYAVVATKPESLDASSVQNTSPWFLVPAGALAGIVALLACVFLLNFELPRLDRLFERATKHVDPQLTGVRRTFEWLYGSMSGRLFALAWAGLGATVTIQELSSRALTDESAPEESDYRRGAELAAYPGRDVYEFRNHRWKKCPRPFQCLRNYDHGESQALAGDRNVLCHYARETHAAELDFRSDIGIPMVYALLLPVARVEAAVDAPASARQKILEALREEIYSGSPWRACDAPVASVGSGG